MTNPEILKIQKKIAKLQQQLTDLQSCCDHDWTTTNYGCSGEFYEREYWKSIRCVKCGEQNHIDSDDPLYRSTPIPDHVHKEVRTREW